MPRNSSGVYTLPAGNPVVTGTLIQSTWANPTLSDVANELTNSLDRAGRGSMTAAFKAFDGTVSAPGISFSAEPSTGMYRVSGGTLGFATSGVLRGSVNGSGQWALTAATSGVTLSVATLTGNRSFQAGVLGSTNNPRIEFWHTEAGGISRMDFSASTGTLAGQFSIAGVNYMTVASNGAITIPTPASAITQLTIAAPFNAGSIGLVVGDTTTNARTLAQIGGISIAIGQQFAANTPEIWSNDTDGLNIGLTASAGASASLTFWTNLVARHQIGGAGNQIMFSPTSGTTLQVRNNGEVDQLVFSTWNGNPVADQFGIKHNGAVSRIGSIRSGGSLQLMYGAAVTSATIGTDGQWAINAVGSGSHSLLTLAATDRAWGSGYTAVGLGTYGHWLDSSSGLTGIIGNAYFDGTNWKYMTTNPVGFLDVGSLSGRMRLIYGVPGTAGNNVTLIEAMGISYTTGKVNFERGVFTTTNSQAFSATPTFDANLSNVFEFSGAMTANVTSCTINGQSNGQTIQIRVKQDGTGGRTFAAPSGAKIQGTINTTAGCASILTLTWSMMDARWEGSWLQLPA